MKKGNKESLQQQNTDKTKIILSEKQLKGLEVLSAIDITTLVKAKKISIIGRFFRWIDTNVFSHTLRLWLYLLESVGIIAIFIILNRVSYGLNLISRSVTEHELKVAEVYVNSIIQLAPSIATMIATICGALPAIIGLLKSLNKKWENGSSHPNENGVNE